MNSLDAEPMMSLDKFIEQTGRKLPVVTAWRYRKKTSKPQKLTQDYVATRDNSPKGVIQSHLPVIHFRLGIQHMDAEYAASCVLDWPC